MTFQDDLEELKSLIEKPLRTLEEVEAIAHRLEDVIEDKNPSVVNDLMDLCEKSLAEVNRASNQIKKIKRNWGSASSPDDFSRSGNITASFKDLSVFDIKEENKTNWRCMEWALEEKFPPLWEQSNKNPPNLSPNQRSTGASYASPEEQAENMYQRIREMNDDVDKIASNLDVPDNIVSAVRTHIFIKEHDIAVGPGTVKRSRFEADLGIANLWISAYKDILSEDDLQTFKRIFSHEYVEQGLMKRGLPYRSPHSEAWKKAWKKDVNIPTKKYYGAHDLAPLCDTKRKPFEHWGVLGLVATQLPSENLDLSKLETLVEIIAKITNLTK